jgi:hypothetical protein
MYLHFIDSQTRGARVRNSAEIGRRPIQGSCLEVGMGGTVQA